MDLDATAVSGKLHLHAIRDEHLMDNAAADDETKMAKTFNCSEMRCNNSATSIREMDAEPHEACECCFKCFICVHSSLHPLVIAVMTLILKLFLLECDR